MEWNQAMAWRVMDGLWMTLAQQSWGSVHCKSNKPKVESEEQGRQGKRKGWGDAEKFTENRGSECLSDSNEHTYKYTFISESQKPSHLCSRMEWNSEQSFVLASLTVQSITDRNCQQEAQHRKKRMLNCWCYSAVALSAFEYVRVFGVQLKCT